MQLKKIIAWLDSSVFYNNNNNNNNHIYKVPCMPTEGCRCAGEVSVRWSGIIIIITDLYSAFRSEDTEALGAAQED